MFGNRKSAAFAAAATLALGTWGSFSSSTRGEHPQDGTPTTQPTEAGDKRPPFDLERFYSVLRDSRLEVFKDGKNDVGLDGAVTIETLLKRNAEKPVIVLSMGAVCPHAIRSQPLYNTLFSELKERAAVVLVFNGTVEQAREFRNKTGCSVLTLCDPKCLVSYDGSPLERSSVAVTFINGRPQVLPLEISEDALPKVAIPCSIDGFHFIVDRVASDKTAREEIWTAVKSKIGEALKALSSHYGCPSAPQGS